MAQFVFPKVEIEKPKYSKRDLSKPVVGSFNVGSIYPVLSLDVLPGDKFVIKTFARIESLPMIAPVYGRWKATFDYYFEPWSNLYGFMDNNTRLDTSTIINMDRHQMLLGSTLQFDSLTFDELIDELDDNKVSARGSLLDWLGVPVGYVGATQNNNPGVGVSGTAPTAHPAERILTYIDIVRNYYVNNQQKNTCYTYFTRNVDEDRPYGTQLGVKYVDLDVLDDLFRRLRSNRTPVDFGQGDVEDDGNIETFDSFVTDLLYASRFDSCGLFTRTYHMDLLRGILSTDVGNVQSFVSTGSNAASERGFTIDTLNFYTKMYNFINRIDLSGGRFSDWIRTRWAVAPPKDIDRPVYLGSHSTWIDTTDVIATAAGTTQEDVDSKASNSVLGQQAGFAFGAVNAKRPIVLKSNEYGTLMCCFSLYPDVMYSQGFELDMLKTSFADIYDPAFKQIGYQDVSQYEMSALPAVTRGQYGAEVLNMQISNSVGKRVAWAEYMASLPRAHGLFASGQAFDYWVNNRDYYTYDFQGNRNAFDYSTNIHPGSWNKLFVDQSLNAENLRMFIYFDIDATRPIGKRLMPHL